MRKEETRSEKQEEGHERTYRPFPGCRLVTVGGVCCTEWNRSADERFSPEKKRDQRRKRKKKKKERKFTRLLRVRYGS